MTFLYLFMDDFFFFLLKNKFIYILHIHIFPPATGNCVVMQYWGIC